MKIIKVYKSICISFMIYLSRIILHSLNSFNIIVHISVDNGNQYLPGINARNLAQRHPSRQALKRPYNLALTHDELLRLLEILHIESVAAGDIISAMIRRLNENTGRVDVQGLVREKLYNRIRIEMPQYPTERKETMQARLTELVDGIVRISPLNKDIILHKLNAYNVELDETVSILKTVARQRTEEGIYEILNNLTLIGELLQSRLKSNDILVNEDTLAIMILRLRRRVFDILDFHNGMLSRANTN
ncbi:hypothetical protein C922_03855 [Plasmodium inui San Antonio 1]|uniref:Uncharacterized protein n=1 Tax=Plasmodium inui San Antonio 1 TaxID=1237626 RepID=W6ZYE1_9APIC|nr:hypothetical protein C922_03855 [Plasmodium inui San Antonio 1]EUD65872.1 hypothetical protein C922_03855 [Plasmodium inui San Antonio 1]